MNGKQPARTIMTRPLIKISLAACLLAFTVLLTGCSTTDEKDESENWSAKELYTRAKTELKAGDYELAIQYLETLESRFPFGKYAPQAQLETAYAYYRYEEYDNSIAAAQRFIKLHPTHEHVDYAYYLRGLASFHKKDTALDIIEPQDPSQRDPRTARETFGYFAELVKKFPNSKYVPDAVKRMKYQRNTLAKHELHVAKFYMKRGAFVAAANRAKYVLQNYPQTPVVPEALALMTEAYKSLEMNDLSGDTARVLQGNFPDHKPGSSGNEDATNETD